MINFIEDRPLFVFFYFLFFVFCRWEMEFRKHDGFYSGNGQEILLFWFKRVKILHQEKLRFNFLERFYNFSIIIINAVLWRSMVIFSFCMEDIFLFRNVFITGSAGVGKSFLLNEILKSLKHSKVYVTASTGVAACNIGGTTFHRFVVGLPFTFSIQCLTYFNISIALFHWNLSLQVMGRFQAKYFPDML